MNTGFAAVKKEVAAELKKTFPGVKFSLTKRHYDVLVVQYDDTIVPRESIRKITEKYEGKSFDGMIDLETYTNYSGVGYILINPYGNRPQEKA